MRAKSIALCCVAVFVWLMAYPAWAAGSNDPEGVVQLYFTALKEGDIAGIKNVVSESFYSKRKVLLDQNRGYADFLRKIYSNADINIINVDISDDRAYVRVEQSSDGNNRNETVLELVKDDVGSWKIDQEQY
jgi:hypothetical protein